MTQESSKITYKPLGITHTLIAFIFGITIISINAIEFYFLSKSGGLSSTSLNVFWIMMQNVGIAIPNSYYLSKIQVTTTGLSESTGAK